MKIAASDYDGTIFRNKNISAETVQGVHAWRLAGNKFGMVSGRDYGMLTPQLKHYGIEYDFVISNNGGIIRDKAGNVLYQANIDSHILKEISVEPIVRKSFHFAFSAKDTTYLCHDSEGSWIMREAEEWDFPITKISEDEISKLVGVHQFSLGFDDPKIAFQCADLLNKKFPDEIQAYPNAKSVDIAPVGISKRQGLDTLMKAMNWQDCELYVIGDEVNDLPMIQAFGGYTVNTSRDEIKSQARQVFDDVGAMLKFFL